MRSLSAARPLLVHHSRRTLGKARPCFRQEACVSDLRPLSPPGRMECVPQGLAHTSALSGLVLGQHCWGWCSLPRPRADVGPLRRVTKTSGKS